MPEPTYDALNEARNLISQGLYQQARAILIPLADINPNAQKLLKEVNSLSSIDDRVPLPPSDNKKTLRAMVGVIGWVALAAVGIIVIPGVGRRRQQPTVPYKRGWGSYIIYFLSACVFLFLAYAAYTMIRDDRREQQQREATVTSYGQDIIDICKTPTGTASRRAMNVEGVPPRVLILPQGDNLPYIWHDELPEINRASNRDDLDWLICVVEYAATIETCPFTRKDSKSDNPTFNITRDQPRVDLYIYNAAQNQLVEKSTLLGGVPPICPEEISVTEDAKTQSYLGSAVTYQQFYTKIESYLENN